MSYVEVFFINPHGDVESFGEARNNHGGAPLIWEHLARKYKFSTREYVIGDHEGLERLWAACSTGLMERWEDVLLASTFDRIYVPPALVSEVAETYKRFYEEVVRPQEKVATCLSIAKLLQDIVQQGRGQWGAAFNHCSAVMPFWRVPEDEDDEDGEDERFYNVKSNEPHPRGEYKGQVATSIENCLPGWVREDGQWVHPG